ncbi:hypothetical protein [Methanosarcina sp.]|uniref:hypothetical protein n=1 Tax=Methanosarcina sp. TaxID=2213 RepID=UPI003C7345EA
MKEHQTGEGRVTTYTNDFAPASNSAGTVISAITQIEYPTGGVTKINYDLKQIFYQSGVQTFAYAVKRIEKGGHIWDYEYLNTGPSSP